MAAKIAHYDIGFVKPLDENLLHTIFQKFDDIITIEDGTINGGFGSAVLEFIQDNNYTNKRIKRLGIPDQFIEHGSNEQLLKIVGLNEENILKTINSFA
jgi:1-deoxy-D-xylulose-5-phosphate synthase